MENYKYIKFLKVYIQIEKAGIKIGDIDIEKQKFHKHKRPTSIKKYRYY